MGSNSLQKLGMGSQEFIRKKNSHQDEGEVREKVIVG